ncbi:DUF7660 family protein [Paracidovorax avenae]|uniref:DUF7660 family protein n=1 Tax=Paracidovorax avenae TaxID=80867 RepID=UPI001AD8196B|nr:hypothetical protein [Paracidovorax avenae]
MKTSEIKSKEQFIYFLKQLSKDFSDNPESWSNRNLSEFLSAMQSWAEDMDGYYENLEISNINMSNGSWRIFADILVAARNYE